MIHRATVVAISAAVLLSIAMTASAEAAPPTKDECLQAHSKGQDLKEAHRLAEAKRVFLVCAQQVCPALVQSDCARFDEELERTVPSVSFTARDSSGSDLPDTQVFVDEKLLATSLGDGKAYDVDPGSHRIRFVHAGVSVTLDIVSPMGDKGRNVLATFGGPPNSGTATGATKSTPQAAAAEEPSRPLFPLVVAGVGGAAMIAGVVLAFVGNGQIPSQCSTANNTCRAPEGDKVFDDASSARKLTNVGLAVSISGLAVGLGGLVWYFVSPKQSSSVSGRNFFEGVAF